MERTPCATYPKMFLRVCRFQNGKAAKYLNRSKAKSSQSSHRKPPKSPFGEISPHSFNESCRASNSVWKIGIISLIWSTQCEMGAKRFSWIWLHSAFSKQISVWLISDRVDQMRLMIPIFNTEFDALQVSFHKWVEIPPHGDFGGFLWLFWLFYHLDATKYLKALPFWNLHISRNISGCMVPGARSITNTVWLTRRVEGI